MNTTDVSNLEVHPLAEGYPLLTGAEFETFKASVKASGQRVRIVLFEGKILDGRNRYRACRELRIEPQCETFTGTAEQAAVYAEVLNLHRRHLSRDQMRAIVECKLRENPDRSDRAIAEDVKVDHKTVAAVRKRVAPVGEFPQQDRKQRKGKDGKQYKATKPRAAKPTPKANPLLESAGTFPPDAGRVDDKPVAIQEETPADVVEEEEEKEDPQNLRTAYLLKAAVSCDLANWCAGYPGRITQEIADAAFRAGRAWMELAEKMGHKAAY